MLQVRQWPDLTWNGQGAIRLALNQGSISPDLSPQSQTFPEQSRRKHQAVALIPCTHLDQGQTLLWVDCYPLTIQAWASEPPRTASSKLTFMFGVCCGAVWSTDAELRATAALYDCRAGPWPSPDGRGRPPPHRLRCIIMWTMTLCEASGGLAHRRRSVSVPAPPNGDATSTGADW